MSKRGHRKAYGTYMYANNQCKYCNAYDRLSFAPAIEGLDSQFITDSLIASQRPATVLMKKYNIIKDMKSKNVGAIINLQQKNEWGMCGHPIHEEGFSYRSKDFKEHGIEVYEMGWKDNTAPATPKHMLQICKQIDTHVKKGEKALIHCHAGKGRTGMVLCCYLLYAGIFTDALVAIKHVQKARKVRLDRHIQQEQFIFNFEIYLQSINSYETTGSESETSNPVALIEQISVESTTVIAQKSSGTKKSKKKKGKVALDDEYLNSLE